MMRIRWMICGLCLWLAFGALMAAQGGNGKGKGFPNHGITAPGEPNHYASPKPPVHP